MSVQPDTQPSPDEGTGTRRREILEIAAQLFSRNGYRGTSIRDIGDEAGIRGGSLYYHIRSKDALFVEIHNAAIEAGWAQIEDAMSDCRDPWAKLEAACAAMLEIQLAPDSLTLPMMNDLREVPASVRVLLVEARDRFEARFRALIDELPLPEWVDRSIYRNLLLSLLNATAEWYRPGRLSPREVARQILTIFKHR